MALRLDPRLLKQLELFGITVGKDFTGGDAVLQEILALVQSDPSAAPPGQAPPAMFNEHAGLPGFSSGYWHQPKGRVQPAQKAETFVEAYRKKAKLVATCKRIREEQLARNAEAAATQQDHAARSARLAGRR